MPIKRGSLICRRARWARRSRAIWGNSSAGLGSFMGSPCRRKAQAGQKNKSTVLLEPSLEQQGGGQGVHRVIPITTALALGHALALRLEGGQAFVVGVHWQVEAA